MRFTLIRFLHMRKKYCANAKKMNSEIFYNRYITKKIETQ